MKLKTLYRYSYVLLLFFLYHSNIQAQSNLYEQLLEEVKECDLSLEECINFIDSCINVFDQEGIHTQKSELYYQKGRRYFMSGMQEEAIFNFNQGVNEAAKYKDSISLATNYSGLGSVYFMQGNMENAISNYITAATIQENIKDYKNFIVSHINISAALYNMKNYSESLRYLFKALEIIEQNQPHDYEGALKSNIGIHYYQLKMYDSAKYWGQKALEIPNISNEIDAQILGNYALGAVYLEEDSIAKAIDHLQVAINQAREYNLAHYLGEALGVYARALSRNNQYLEAIAAIEEVKKIQNAFGNYLGMAQAYRTAGEIYNQHGEYKLASDDYAIYINLYDSLLQEDATEKVVELDRKYKAAQKEQELLQRELEIAKKNNWMITIVAALVLLILFFIAYRRQQYVKALRKERLHKDERGRAFIRGEQMERERLAKELHDGVASMVGAAKMNLETVAYLPDDKRSEHIDRVLNILGETHQDIRLIAHDLMPLNLQRKGLWPALIDFINLYPKGQYSVDFNIDIAEELNQEKWADAKEVVLYRILQEVIQNIYKHSQADQASLEIKKVNKNLEIIIKDNGIGIEGEHLSQGIGLQTIDDRIQFLEGQWEMKTNTPRGLLIFMSIPFELLKRN